jgi:hypothetical protein
LVNSEGIVSDGKQTLPCFEFELSNKKETLLIIPEHEDRVQELRNAFQYCSKVNWQENVAANNKETSFEFSNERLIIFSVT